jgi:hypothetical protein
MKFQTVRIEGNTISAEILDKISEGDYPGQQPQDFGLTPGVKVKDEIARAWADAQNQWKIFKSRTSNLYEGDSGLPEVRKYWMIPFFGLLNYNLELAQADKLENGNSYAISHRENSLDRFPVHIVGFVDKELGAPEERSTLDIKPSNASRRMSPHALVQEYVNLTEYAYAIITNGYQLRLLRDSSRLVKLSFLEFDVRQMMEEEAFADFAVLYRLLHASRMAKNRDLTSESLIEQYHLNSLESGARIREGLSGAVENSIKAFANGFLRHPANEDLRDAVSSKRLSAEIFYQNQLRLIYRLLFLMVIEERNLIYSEKHNKKLRDIYYHFYSVERLRRLIDNRLMGGAQHSDRWEGLKKTFQLFEREQLGGALEIKPLDGDLFGPDGIGQLIDCTLPNNTLSDCLRNLTVFVNNDTHQITRVNYASLNVEEFGSVYEGLLEYDPMFLFDNTGQISFEFKQGKDRSSSGSHYTPEELVQPLIKHSLEHIIQDKLKEKDQEHALLSIAVCDVACGSGHILLSAARRIAREVARVRTNEEQPAPSALRSAIRDVIKNCIYGVDKNPLAVELCKVALWLESHNPGEPLGFLDHRIKCGDAIVGLGRYSELENGIPNDTFRTAEGDDKDIASALLARNKEEKKSKSQISLDFSKKISNELNEVLVHYGRFFEMPERTPTEIVEKKHAYGKFTTGPHRMRLEQLADAQIGQFFIQKTHKTVDHAITEEEFRKELNRSDRALMAIQNSKFAFTTTMAKEARAFHWFLEFPEVLNAGGFDCVLGNPPFLGGQKLTGNFGERYLRCLKYEFDPIGAVDLVTYFFRRIFTLIKNGGFQSLISTNSISQGKTREDGLDVIVNQNGGTINHAVRSMKWPGKAAVEVALVTIYKGKWERECILNGKRTGLITSFLDDSAFIANPFVLKQNQNKSFMGCVVLGNGFIVEPSRAMELIAQSPNYKRVLFPYLSGEDLNNSPDQSANRWIINFFDWPLRRYNPNEWATLTEAERSQISERIAKGKQVAFAPPSYKKEVASDFPECLRIVESTVKPERERDGNRMGREYWWQYYRRGVDLYNVISTMDRVLAVAQVSKTVGFSFVPTDQVISMMCIVVAFDTGSYFSILQSTINKEWIYKFGSALKSDIRYTPSDVFETFPFPPRSIEAYKQLEQIGMRYHEHRRQTMLRLKLGLTKLYGLFHSPNLTTADIEKQSKQPTESCIKGLQDIQTLRDLHVQIDQAVLDAYRWADIHPRHDFREIDYLPENDRVRYAIHPDARNEILKRLLERNYKIHDEEVKAGLWTEKKSYRKESIAEEPKSQYGLGF